MIRPHIGFTPSPENSIRRVREISENAIMRPVGKVLRCLKFPQLAIAKRIPKVFHPWEGRYVWT